MYGNAEDPPAEHLFAVVIPEAPNDDFADAAVLEPGAAVSVNNGKATAEPGEPSHDSWYFAQGLGADFSVWYAYTPDADGTAELDWCATGFDVDVAVYTGTAVGALHRVSNQEPPGCTDALPVRGGTTYRIAVDGAARNRDYGTGPVTLSLAFAPGEPVTGEPPTGSSQWPSEEPPSGGGAIPDAAPVASLVFARSGALTTRVDRGGRFAVPGARLACAAGATCTARVKVRSRRRGGRALGGATLIVGPAAERAVRATLRRSARRRLARTGRLAVWVRIGLSDGSTTARRVTLLAPRRRA
jgi:hypothetical protein